MTVLYREIEREIRNVCGTRYTEVARRSALFSKVLENKLNREKGIRGDKTNEFIVELLKDAFILYSGDVVELLIGLYKGEYVNEFIEENREIFDEAVRYLVYGSAEEENQLSKYYLDKADKISQKVTCDYLRELIVLEN